MAEKERCSPAMDSGDSKPYIFLKDDAGIRHKEDVTYSKVYIKELRRWMLEKRDENIELTLERIHFEDDLIKERKIRLECDKNFQLGLDMIVESMSPQEDLEFEAISIKFGELDPTEQIPKIASQDQFRREECDRFKLGLSLIQADSIAVSSLGNWSEFSRGDDSRRLFRIPEPPYSDFCRNKPPDLKISHLRALREDGYFDNRAPDVQIAAYLISKGHWRRYQIVNFFGNFITWERFLSAQAKVHHHIRKTWPERLKRIESVKESLSEKQLRAFEVKHDIDLVPTIKKTAERLKTAQSSLNELLGRVKRKFREEFKELWSVKKHPKKWSQECDFDETGFYRKSLGSLKNCPLIKADGTREYPTESKHVDANIYSYDECEHIKAELKRLDYPPELKTVIGSAGRGTYDVRRGEYHHQTEDCRFITLWRKIYYLTHYSDEEASIFTRAILKREDEGRSLFSIRHRLKTVRRRRIEKGQPTGRFARAQGERSGRDSASEPTSQVIDAVAVAPQQFNGVPAEGVGPGEPQAQPLAGAAAFPEILA